MLRKCYSCGTTISHFSERCPKCKVIQRDPKLVRKAGRVFKRRTSYFSLKEASSRFGT